jgi:hypothetical protein
MKTKQILYLSLCVLGTLLPYSQLVPFVFEHGLNPTLFVQQLFATKISGFFGLDVVVSTVVLWLFLYFEGARLKMRRLWIYVIASLVVGVSLALPLFLLARESRLNNSILAETR